MTDRRTFSARRNALVRHRGPHHPLTLEADRDLRAARLIEHARQIADDPVPLTGEQLATVEAILASAHSEMLDATGLEDSGQQ